MNCSEAEQYLSALYDGEGVPDGVAQHAATCRECREVLNDYSQMGVEMRLAAAAESPGLPPLRLLPRRRRLAFLYARVSIPRFALATLLAALVVVPVGVSLLRAQSRPLWFQFGYSLRPNDELYHYVIARAGYDDVHGTLGWADGKPVSAVMRMRVESITEDEVVLRCRAINAGTNPDGSMRFVPKASISLDQTRSVRYKPGETLSIPIEGGGTFYLKGDIFDHQPKLAFGFPLEPASGKLLVRSPLLAASHRYIGELDGASALTVKPEEAIVMQAGANGRFYFSLRQFAGAVEGKAEWGEIKFKLDDENYRLLAAAPITGGDQPVPVWVRRDSSSDDRVLLGVDPLPR